MILTILNYFFLTKSVDCQNIKTEVDSLSTRAKIAEFANSVDLDEVAHDEPPHLDLHCLPSSL